LRAQIPREAVDAVAFDPDAPIDNVDTGEDIRPRKLVLLALRRLVAVGGKCGDIHESRNPRVSPSGGNESPAIGVTDEQHRRTDAAECFLDGGEIGGD
jgi:hypothetical protein